MTHTAVALSSLESSIANGIRNHLQKIEELNSQGKVGIRSAEAVKELHKPLCSVLVENNYDAVLERPMPDYFGGTHKADVGLENETFEFKCFKTSYDKNHKNYLRNAASESLFQKEMGFNCNSIVIAPVGMLNEYQLSGWERLAKTHNLLVVIYDENFNLTFPITSMEDFFGSSSVLLAS